MTKKTKLFGALLGAALLLPITANATLIVGDQNGGFTDVGQFAGNNLNQNILEDDFGADLLWTADGGESGSNDLFTIEWIPNGDEPSLAILTPTANFDINDWDQLYVVNKADGSFAVYDVTALGWDGLEAIELGIYENEFAPPEYPTISHISVYGTAGGGGGGNNVPDGGATVALMGLGLLGIGFINRKSA